MTDTSAQGRFGACANVEWNTAHRAMNRIRLHAERTNIEIAVGSPSSHGWQKSHEFECGLTKIAATREQNASCTTGMRAATIAGRKKGARHHSATPSCLLS